MTIKFLHNKHSDVNWFINRIGLKISTLFHPVNWEIADIEGISGEGLRQLFEILNADLLILPGARLTYPVPSQFKILALLDHESHNKMELPDYEKYVLLARKARNGPSELFGDMDLRKNYGKVYITGFGPGDPDLLTVKAVKAIENADVIFYDSLINQQFLDNYNKEKIFVGKRKGNHSHSQEHIDELLYQSALSGKNTVRLKGGDPFIYGRGGEEFDYLRKRFIDVEIIPGITAAFGAAAYNGISLTQRGISSSVAFCTGFPRTDRRIPDADTLVFYMSASNLKETAEILLQNGREASTPVALIRNATLANQEAHFASLNELAHGKVALASPLVAIIGEVATNKNFSVITSAFLPENETYIKTEINL